MNKVIYDEVMKIKSRLSEITQNEENDFENSVWNEEQKEQSESFTTEINNAISYLNDIEEFEEIPDELVEGDEVEEDKEED